MDDALRAAGASGFSSSLNNPTVFKLQEGYQINRNWAIEAGYFQTNYENYSATGGNLPGPVTASARASGWHLSGVGILPLANQFSLLGKLGIASIEDEVTLSGPGGTLSASGTKIDTTYGIGAKYDVTKHFFGRLDVDSIKVGNSSSSSRYTVWTIDLGYMF